MFVIQIVDVGLYGESLCSCHQCFGTSVASVNSVNTVYITCMPARWRSGVNSAFSNDGIFHYSQSCSFYGFDFDASKLDNPTCAFRLYEGNNLRGYKLKTCRNSSYDLFKLNLLVRQQGSRRCAKTSYKRLGVCHDCRLKTMNVSVLLECT